MLTIVHPAATGAPTRHLAFAALEVAVDRVVAPGRLADVASESGQTKGGDSGAPWVGTPTANGIHIGIPKPGDIPCESEFQSVRAAAARLNVYGLTTGNEAITCAAGIKRNENGRYSN